MRLGPTHARIFHRGAVKPTFSTNWASVVRLSTPIHLYNSEVRILSQIYHYTSRASTATLPTLLRRGAKFSTMPAYSVDDVLSVRELYQDRVLARPREDAVVEKKPSQELNDRVGLIGASIANLELDAIVNVRQTLITTNPSDQLT